MTGPTKNGMFNYSMANRSSVDSSYRVFLNCFSFDYQVEQNWYTDTPDARIYKYYLSPSKPVFDGEVELNFYAEYK